MALRCSGREKPAAKRVARRACGKGFRFQVYRSQGLSIPHNEKGSCNWLVDVTARGYVASCLLTAAAMISAYFASCACSSQPGFRAVCGNDRVLAFCNTRAVESSP